jgi:hypothetical protein
MLQKNESVEIPSTVARITATNEVPVELPAQNTNVELAELVVCLEEGFNRRKKHFQTSIKSINKRGVVVFTPFALVLLCLMFAMFRGLFSPAIAIGIMVVSFTLWMPTLKYQVRRHRSVSPAPLEQERLAVLRLVEIEDIRAVAPLIDCLSWGGDSTMHPEIWQALGRLLPRLTVEQARALGPERHGRLVLWLQAWELSPSHSAVTALGNMPTLGILHVLAHLGQRSIIPYHPMIKQKMSLLAMLGEWADGKKLGQDPMVQQAAAACCHAIRNQTALGYSGEQLLRASVAASPDPKSLLRPTQGAQQTAPQELLRATSTNEDDDDSE